MTLKSEIVQNIFSPLNLTNETDTTNECVAKKFLISMNLLYQENAPLTLLIFLLKGCKSIATKTCHKIPHVITKKIPRESCKKVPDIECFNVLKEVPELECTPQPYEVNEKSLKIK